MIGLRRALSLTREERWLVARAVLHLLVFHLALRTLGLKRVASWASRPISAHMERTVLPSESRKANSYARWIEVASRHHLVPAMCLCRSLVLHYWLRKEGLPSELRIGVRKGAHKLEAHAWVELSGQVINDAPTTVAAFTPMRDTQGNVLIGIEDSHRQVRGNRFAR
ncbi:MAG: lasso peptide biosynthesis B2 protein [Chloroflexi bacterium]|nr:lasso peptide biosynthesis B2 protein [Chloroflexota bacterium]